VVTGEPLTGLLTDDSSLAQAASVRIRTALKTYRIMGTPTSETGKVRREYQKASPLANSNVRKNPINPMVAIF